VEQIKVYMAERKGELISVSVSSSLKLF